MAQQRFALLAASRGRSVAHTTPHPGPPARQQSIGLRYWSPEPTRGGFSVPSFFCTMYTLTATGPLLGNARAMLPRFFFFVAATCLLVGCSLAPAPSFELFGAYFPAWMLCALIGILGAGSTRVILTSPTLHGAMPFQLLVCVAVGVIVGLLSWMALFR
jgi:hypothetical protein